MTSRHFPDPGDPGPVLRLIFTAAEIADTFDLVRGTAQTRAATTTGLLFLDENLGPVVLSGLPTIFAGSLNGPPFHVAGGRP